MDWSYLDKPNHNLLYMYARALGKEGGEAHYQRLFDIPQTDNEELREMYYAEERRKTAYYIIWFAFRYVLECKTLEEARWNANREIMKKLKLNGFFVPKYKYIFIGAYGLNEIYLYRPEDLNIVLEIIYNRYDFFQQLECYIRLTEGTNRTSRNRCIKTMQQYKEILRRAKC